MASALPYMLWEPSPTVGLRSVYETLNNQDREQRPRLAWPERLDDSLRSTVGIARNQELPRQERMEAYEELMDSEVGDTHFVRARNLERDLGVRQLFLKFEGNNPTGTQKDRIAFAQVLDALRRGFDAVTVATCGNYGMALSTAASLAGMRCILFIPEGYHPKRLRDMVGFGAEICRVPGDYEHAVHASRALAEGEEVYDANPGGANTLLQLKAYGEIAAEIYDELRDAPAAVCVPVSNGSTLAGVYRGFVSLYRRGKISRLPVMAAGSSLRKNPIVEAMQRDLPDCPDLVPDRIRESAINEPLINWHAFDGNHALQAMRETEGWASGITDRDLTYWARKIRVEEGLSVMPAATAGLAALAARLRTHPLPNDRYVVILTGRNAT